MILLVGFSHGYHTVQELRDSLNLEMTLLMSFYCLSAYFQIPLDEASQDKMYFIVDTDSGI